MAQNFGAGNSNPAGVSTYNWLARQFHWVIAALIFMAFALGLTMETLELSKEKLNFYAWHKWLGMIILMLVVMRLIWRFLTKAPKEQNEQVPALMNLAAKIGHFALYAVLIALPLVGWLRSSSAGFQIVLFEMIPVPDLIGKDEVLSKQLAGLHHLLADALAILVIGHIGAVVVHHLVFKDPVLLKMKPNFVHRFMIFGALIGSVVFYGYYTGFSPKSHKGEMSSVPAVKISKSEGDKEDAKRAQKEANSKAQASWEIDQKVSQLEFIATQKSAKTSGVFKTYKLVQLEFDPEKLSEAVVKIEIDVNSLSVSNTLVEQTLTSSQWFNVSEFPKATFVSNEFKSLGGESYEVSGDLQIKDIVKPAVVKLTINTLIDDTTGTEVIEAKGATTLSRLSYKIGQGEWSSTDDLADDVQLTIHIRALKSR